MATSLTSITGIGPALAKRMSAAGYDTVPKVAAAATDGLAQVQGVSEATAARIISAAKAAAPTTAARIDALEKRVSKLEADLAAASKSKTKSKKAAKGKKKSRKQKKNKKKK